VARLAVSSTGSLFPTLMTPLTICEKFRAMCSALQSGTSGYTFERRQHKREERVVVLNASVHQ